MAALLTQSDHFLQLLTAMLRLQRSKLPGYLIHTNTNVAPINDKESKKTVTLSGAGAEENAWSEHT